TGPGGPVAGAVVSAIGPDDRGATATTAANGEFTINGLAAATYTLAAFSPGLVSQELASVVVSAGATTSGVALPLTGGGQIHGTVPALGGGPLAFTPLVIQGNARSFFTQADSLGEYELSDLPAGAFTVSAVEANFMTTSVNALVTAGGSTDVDLQLPPLATVHGLVTNSTTGQPLPAVTVFAISSLGVLTSDITDPDGTYSLPDLDAGTYSIVVGDPGTPGVARSSVTLNAGTTDATRNFTVAVAGFIHGTVFGADGGTPLGEAEGVVALAQAGDAV